jgi:hypothetical protein
VTIQSQTRPGVAGAGAAISATGGIASSSTNRTTYLLALMKKGDDAFNSRDFAAIDEIHHPDMIAYITGLAEPIY